MRERRPQRWGSRAGFTLTEIVVLISIIGILSVTAAPRFLDTTATDARLHHRETLSALRYARKLAVASHCPVQFDFTGSGYTLMQRASCSSGTWTQNVFDPASGASSYAGVTPDGVNVTSSIDPMYFDTLGRVVNGSDTATDVAVSVGGIAITALGESGFIHAP